MASAGGLDALSTILRALPADFPAAVAIHQHLSRYNSVLPTILARHSSRKVCWAVDGDNLDTNRIVACPPSTNMEIVPDGTWSLSGIESVGEKRFDLLLTSLASSYGNRGLAVVLSGSGRDGAAGTEAMRRAGGFVIAQSEETAEYPSMPRAAAAAGANLVLPIYEIGRVLTDVVGRGEPLPRPHRKTAATALLFAGPGEIRAWLRRVDWSTTPLGPVPDWAVRIAGDGADHARFRIPHGHLVGA